MFNLMLGQIRSTGCLTCRQNKVKVLVCIIRYRRMLISTKCNRTEPPCSRCKKTGRTCMYQRRRQTQPSFLAALPLSTADIRSFQLIECCNEGPIGMRFDLIARWLKLLPPRLGRSCALDDAVSLINVVHKRMLHCQDPSEWISPSAYTKALRSLRNALPDPEEGRAVETLAAALILYHIEVSLRNTAAQISA
jgi:hypothetical protein